MKKKNYNSITVTAIVMTVIEIEKLDCCNNIDDEDRINNNNNDKKC